MSSRARKNHTHHPDQALTSPVLAHGGGSQEICREGGRKARGTEARAAEEGMTEGREGPAEAMLLTLQKFPPETSTVPLGTLS
jgi:hypothetical protein